jgi:hypothetical protein
VRTDLAELTFSNEQLADLQKAREVSDARARCGCLTGDLDPPRSVV